MMVKRSVTRVQKQIKRVSMSMKTILQEVMHFWGEEIKSRSRIRHSEEVGFKECPITSLRTYLELLEKRSR